MSFRNQRDGVEQRECGESAKTFRLSLQALKKKRKRKVGFGFQMNSVGIRGLHPKNMPKVCFITPLNAPNASSPFFHELMDGELDLRLPIASAQPSFRSNNGDIRRSASPPLFAAHIPTTSKVPRQGRPKL